MPDVHALMRRVPFGIIHSLLANREPVDETLHADGIGHFGIASFADTLAQHVISLPMAEVKALASAAVGFQ